LNILQNEQKYSELVNMVIEAFTSVLGPRNILSDTKKILKWEDESGLLVNISSNNQKSVTVWVYGIDIDQNYYYELESASYIKSRPPINSNVSKEIKYGPTLHTKINNSDNAIKFAEKIIYMFDEAVSVVDGAEISNSEGSEGREAKFTRVLTEVRDESIDSLIQRVKRGRLIVQPEFQRDFVWPLSKCSALVESVLMRIPLPVIYVSETESGTWEVVDGQQRLTTLKSFVDGRFPAGNIFKLSRLSVLRNVNGYKFDDLPDSFKNAFLDYTIRVILIQKDADPELKFDVFERLNSGAEKLNDMELRNCIYRGPYNDLLKGLSYNQTLLKIRGETIPDSRMQDRQLILRFFAMCRQTHLRYKGSMKEFMNNEMRENRFSSEDEINRLKGLFENTIQICWDVFGPHAFRRFDMGSESTFDGRWNVSKRLNVALWDTIMYVFSYYERRQIFPYLDSIRESFIDLISTDLVFIDYIGRTTDKQERVRYRAEVWKNRVDEIVAIPENEARNFNYKIKEKLFKRADICALCHQKIHTIDDAALDHISEYWKGGRTIPDNCRLVHRYCNLTRSR